MKLICRKCKKEIFEFKLDRFKDDKMWATEIEIECHGKKETKTFHSLANNVSTSDYGDIYFFEKDEEKPVPETEMNTWGDVVALQFRNSMLQIEIDELKRENKGLKKSNKEWIKKIADSDKYCYFPDGNDPLSEVHCTERYNRLLNENLGLKERIERLKPITWSKEKPTEPGWYWWKTCYNPIISRMLWYDPLMPDKYLDCEWAGPIPEPKNYNPEEYFEHITVGVTAEPPEEKPEEV